MNTSYEINRNKTTDEWLTPRWLLNQLGEFDLDPCSPIIRPWPTAKNHYTQADNGLMKDWIGRVWCNPPYGDQTGLWLSKLASHGDGIALVFCRPSTKTFQGYVFGVADAIFFIRGRLKFWTVEGKEGGPAGADSVLIAYGRSNSEVLRNLPAQYGKFVSLKSS